MCCGAAIIAVSGRAAACSLAISVEEHMQAGAASVRLFWLTSIFLGGLILCLDAYKRTVSAALVVAAGLLLVLGWLLYRQPHWGEYLPSCEPFLLWPVQLVSGVLMALLVYRVLQAIRRR
jgi:hypothetical protein